MNCWNCRQSLDKEANRCLQCQSPFGAICATCETANPPQATYCLTCGAPLHATTDGMEQWLGEKKLPEESERRVVTILFADIRGFTALSERLDPEEVTTVINDCFTSLANEIDKYGGFVDKFMGDAVMALFGAPETHENDPERAIMAALGMQQALIRFSRRIERRLGLPLQMRIGINTGPVVSGWIGSPKRRQYTVMGDAVNLASRIEHAANIGTVWVNETTWRLARHAFDATPIPPFAVKGKTEPVQCYEIVGVKRQRQAARGVAGLYAPMIGRDREMAALQAALNDVQAGQPVLVSIVGEAGIGKSRLFQEFELTAGQHYRWGSGKRPPPNPDDPRPRLLAIKGHSLPYDQLNSYATLRSLLYHYLGSEEGDNPLVLRQKVTTQIPNPARQALIGRLLGLAYPDERLDHLNAEELKRETHIAVIETLLAEAATGPLLLILEDNHWIDPASLDLLRALLAQVSTQPRPVMIISLHRPDFTGLDNGITPASLRLSLQPLTADESRELIDALLNIPRLPDELKNLIIRQSDGNPFYVEEIIKSFIDRGDIYRNGTYWEARDGISDVTVPDTLQGVLMARMDSLGEPEKRTLQQAAVIGQTFPQPVLAKITDVTGPLDHYLDRLEDREFIMPVTEVREAEEYTFRHLLSREVAYESLLIARRRFFHRRIGACLEAMHADHLEGYLDVLAEHYYRGQQWDKALDYTLKAGSRAQSLYINQTALAYFDRALEMLDRLERGEIDLFEAGESAKTLPPETLCPIRREVLTHRGEVYAVLSRYDQAINDYQTALGLCDQPEKMAYIRWRLADVHEQRGQYATAVNDLQAAIQDIGGETVQSVEMARILALLGWILIRQGKHNEAERLGQQSLAILQGTPLWREIALAYKTLGSVYMRRSEWNLAIENWQKSLEINEQIGERRESARLYNNLAIAHFRRGDYEKAEDFFSRCLSVMEQMGDTDGVAGTLNNLGGVCRARGDSKQAITYYQQALAIKARIGDQRGVARGHINLGEIYRDIGESAQAISHLQESLQIVQQLEANESLPECHRQLAEAYLDAGDRENGLNYAQRALQEAVALDNRLEEGLSHRAFGRAYHLQGNLEQAEGELNQSGAILTALKSERELAVTLVAAGQLYRDQGRRDKARDAFQRAIDLFRKQRAEQDAQRVQDELDKT